MLPIIEVGANLLFAGLAIYYMNTILEKGEKTARWKMVLFWLLYFGTVTILTYQSGFDGLWSIVYGLILFTYSCVALYGKILLKILYSALWNIIITLSSSFILFLSKILLDRNLFSIYDVRITVRIVEIVSAFLLRLILIKLLTLVKEQRARSRGHNRKFTVIFILICFITWINLVGILMAEMSAIQDNRYIWIMVLFLELTFFLIFLFYLYDRWSRMEQEKIRNEYLEAMNGEQERYIRELILGAEEIRILRHDMNKYLFVLHTYISNGQIEESKKYLEDLKGKGDDILAKDYDSLQAILKNRKRICDKEGIQFHYCVLGNWDQIDTMDLCVLSWNLLDNALEAERKEEKKEIWFEITNYKGYLKIVCKNRIKKSVLEKNPRFITSKKDKESHGLGLASISKMVEKYNGMRKIIEEDSSTEGGKLFIVTVMLQNR